jgi:hypothetical protein
MNKSKYCVAPFEEISTLKTVTKVTILYWLEKEPSYFKGGTVH